MSKNSKPIPPVKPSSLEMIFIYCCPHCKREIPLLAPTRPSMIHCDVCNKHFPIVPVEERSLNFVKLMLNNGAAAIDADFI